MKRRDFIFGSKTAIVGMLVSIALIGCSNNEDYEFIEEHLHTLAPSTRSTMAPEGGFDYPQFLEYSNCGLWGIAQMLGSADNSRYQGAVLSAASSAINWDEDENLARLKENQVVRALDGYEALSVCNRMREINEKASGFEKISGLNNNLPDTFEDDTSKALQIIDNLKRSSNGNRIRGAMVGIEIMREGKLQGHWVPLERFEINGDMQVRDQLTSQQYKNGEKNGTSLYSDRYKNNYPVSIVKCILYKK